MMKGPYSTVWTLNPNAESYALNARGRGVEREFFIDNPLV